MGANLAACEAFNKACRDWAKDRQPAEVNKAVRMIGLEAIRRIVMRTPVDTGVTRANWQTTLWAPSTKKLSSKDKSGAAAIAQANKTLGSLPNFPVVYIANSQDHIMVLELGLYPNPSKKEQLAAAGLLKAPRTRSKAKQYRAGVLTKGGFSKQAPQGMVGITAQELRQMFP